MAASRILLVETDDAARGTIEGPLTAAGHTVQVVSDPADALRLASNHQLVIIDRLAGAAPTQLCRSIRSTPALASLGIMCVSDVDDVETRINFLESGADDVVARPFDARELEARVEALLLRFQRSRELAPVSTPGAEVIATPPRRMVAAFSPKGGSGTTTIAVNVAMSRAIQAPDRVVIIDLDMQFGQVPTFLDVTPRQTLVDLVRDEQAMREPELLRTYATRHDSGLHVLAGPGSPELAEMITPRHVDAILSTVLGTYDFVVIDAGSSLDERAMVAFEHAQSLVFPIYADLAALRAMHVLLEYLNEAGSTVDKATFVLNDQFAKEILKLRDVESALGAKVAVELPYEPMTYVKAVNEGNPVVVAAPRSIAADRLTKLAKLAFENPLVTAAGVHDVESSTNGKRGSRFAFRRR